MKISLIIFLLQAVDIEEKIKNAPDNRYEIGALIGTYLPLALLVIIAYVMYNKAKNRKDLND